MKPFLTLLLLIPVAGLADQAPYSGQQNREIKALSTEQVGQYLQGDGMGYAKVAELNHYPGPRHVLELAAELGLTSDQQEASAEIERRMKADAVRLGHRMVELERKLDLAFSEGTIDAPSLVAMLAEISELEGKIRSTHLLAHLDQKSILRPEQVRRYDELRGYRNGHSGHSH